MRALRVFCAGIATFALASIGLPPRSSSACGNEVLIQLTPVQEIATAEKELEQGKLGQATHRVRLRYPEIRTLNLAPNANPLAFRAQRIYALALVRADGHLDASLGWARWGNLEWALETLTELDKKRTNDPRSQADLAEAKTRLTRTRAEGIKVLEDLDQRDLLGNPFAYMALARARRAAGDSGGAQAAMRRCTMMSTDKRRCETDFMGEPTPQGS